MEPRIAELLMSDETMLFLLNGGYIRPAVPKKFRIKALIKDIKIYCSIFMDGLKKSRSSKSAEYCKLDHNFVVMTAYDRLTNKRNFQDKTWIFTDQADVMLHQTVGKTRMHQIKDCQWVIRSVDVEGKATKIDLINSKNASTQIGD